ncbi:hypothetical protein MMC25_006348 [Agyrium rufum]|nr:hypothetical protein [Agyrium rufum]
MHLSTIFSGLALAASAVAQSTTAQACPSNDVNLYEGCVCPHGTDYQFSKTYAVLGVSAKDFYRYTADFYDVAWQGITNITKNGPDNQVGTTRTYVAPTSVGTLTFTEKLDSFQSRPDGSYVARISQGTIPIEYDTGNGSFSGYWITFDAQAVAPRETWLDWSIYACFTGTPFDFGEQHNYVLSNLLASMKKAGLVKGNTTGPYYVQSF